MRKIFVLTAIILIGFLSASCDKGLSSAGKAGDQGDSSMVGKVETLDEAALNKLLSENRGKVVILDFFATWCPPCKQEVPGFIDLYRKYKDKGLEIIAVAVDKTSPYRINNFVKENDVNYPVYLDSGDLAGKYKIRSIPHTIFIDKSGSIVKTHIGYMSEDAFEKEIKSLL
ncbi:MAG: redoxin domain-containing protein [Candidatus Aureabacteria bacterium]|nr:redoxin domain-containing protein [Candidatus Auribacterota bacterium]